MTERIIRLANKLKDDYGTSDPRELCRCLGVSFLCADLPEKLNGFYMEIAGRRAVAVAARLDTTAARACTAHELGHAVLHRGINTIFLSENTNFVTGRYEREADLFAAALLIDSGRGEESVERLAARYALPVCAVERLFCHKS